MEKRQIESWRWQEWVAVLGVAAALLVLTIQFRPEKKSLTEFREATLRQDLQVMRTAIENYGLDKRECPRSLRGLVDAGYLRVVPIDPMTRKADWVAVPNGDQSVGAITDIHSASDRIGTNGLGYNRW
jgi:general secretion pathway protein G